MTTLLKFTYILEDGSKLNGYIKTGQRDTFANVTSQINVNLFFEQRLPGCEIRFYWIDEEGDEITVATQNDFEIFQEKCEKRLHLFLSPKTSGVKETPATKKSSTDATKTAPQSQIPSADTAAGSNDASNSVHTNVECDSCLMAPIVGFRYKCIQCPNFDLCQNCEAKHIHNEHMMIRMPNANRCPTNIDAWITTGGYGARRLGRKHEKHCKAGDANRRETFSFETSAGCPLMKGESERNKDGGSGRKRGRRHARHNFLSSLYEMMHDLAEGGGAAAAAAGFPTGGETGDGNEATTTTTTTTTTTDDVVAAAAAAAAAHASAHNAHAAAVKSAEIAAKVAHQTALAAATKIMSENLAPTTSAAATAAQADEATKEPSTEKVNANTSPQDPQTPITIPTTPSLQDFVQFLDPKLLKGGMEILSNFNDMFSKILDPMEEADVGDAAAASTSTSGTRKNSTVSTQSNISKKSAESTNSNQKTENKKSDKTEGGDKPQQGANSLLDISDLGSDSESDSVSDSFIKLIAPSKEATPETAANAAIADKTPATPNPSQSSTPPKSLDKSNVMNFAQLSADLKAHIAQEKKEETTRAEEVTVPVEMRAVPVFTKPAVETNSAQSAKPKEKRGEPIYHADERINNSILAMMSMDFSNEGAWLTQLMESVNGNIPEALDLISAIQRSEK